jgi:hypothetical protein
MSGGSPPTWRQPAVSTFQVSHREHFAMKHVAEALQ